MIDTSTKERCCGCTACAEVCPEKAITLKPDKEGFYYPNIDKALCICCNACEKVCSFLTYNKGNTPEKIFAVQHKDENTRRKSSSGGMFTALYKNIILHDGVVYGARFSDEFIVIHDRATTTKECETFRGAKYVQSDMNDVYSRVKTDLLDGKKVLFSGTPCQVAGLQNLTRNIEASNLITGDIVCHGVPSPLIWEQYLKSAAGN